MSAPIFIGYRREDSIAEAGRLHGSLIREFGEGIAFMDTSSMEPGTQWPSEIESTLRSADTILVVIGPDWLRSSDEWGYRRIDQENDWVRSEIEVAIEEDKEIIPLLVKGANVPPAEKMPRSISSLTERQTVEIRNMHWKHDVKIILQHLRKGHTATWGSRGVSSTDPYPSNPPPEGPAPVDQDALEVYLQGKLSKWKRVVSPSPREGNPAQEELVRRYKFDRFLDAIEFMNQVAPGCEIMSHHPRWENIWKSINVHLSTWDIGHRISDRDIQLAEYLDSAFSDFVGAAPEQ